MIRSPEKWSGVMSKTIAISVARAISAISMSIARPRCASFGGSFAAIRPPTTAPARKASSETSGATTGSPVEPAMPKPSSTTLPVMLAAKTRPRPR